MDSAAFLQNYCNSPKFNNEKHFESRGRISERTIGANAGTMRLPIFTRQSVDCHYQSKWSLRGYVPGVRDRFLSPAFIIAKSAIDSTRVDTSPYEQSVFADAVDAIQTADLAIDATISEVDGGKGIRRLFPSGVRIAPCCARQRAPRTRFRGSCPRCAPTFRQRAALQMLKDLTGSRIGYFDFDGAGYVKTATDVSNDNSALMRNIRRHEHELESAFTGICRAVVAASRSLGTEELPEVRVTFDDSIITDTGAEKQHDMAEVAAGLMEAWEYRAKWYGEDEATARNASERAPERVPPTARGGGRRWVAPWSSFSPLSTEEAAQKPTLLAGTRLRGCRCSRSRPAEQLGCGRPQRRSALLLEELLLNVALPQPLEAEEPDGVGEVGHLVPLCVELSNTVRVPVVGGAEDGPRGPLRLRLVQLPAMVGADPSNLIQDLLSPRKLDLVLLAFGEPQLSLGERLSEAPGLSVDEAAVDRVVDGVAPKPLLDVHGRSFLIGDSASSKRQSSRRAPPRRGPS